MPYTQYIFSSGSAYTLTKGDISVTLSENKTGVAGSSNNYTKDIWYWSSSSSSFSSSSAPKYAYHIEVGLGVGTTPTEVIYLGISPYYYSSDTTYAPSTGIQNAIIGYSYSSAKLASTYWLIYMNIIQFNSATFSSFKFNYFIIQN
jgi:hypothetical protein